MEEAKSGVCVACNAQVPKLNEEGKCEGCAGGAAETPATEAEKPVEAPAAEAETPVAE